MAKCNWCQQEMMDDKTISCSGNTEVKFSGESHLPSVLYVDNIRCHDCNVAPNGFHHPGCDMERCPKCSGQLISCGCLDDEEETTRID
jgi:hypothetical protein